ncbi:MAG: hypothetical protein IT441_07555 [Phycisphaeraceae bacterium]|nr:hypothetical protein [Phycisphaeraceae bacterium]
MGDATTGGQTAPPEQDRAPSVTDEQTPLTGAAMAGEVISGSLDALLGKRHPLILRVPKGYLVLLGLLLLGVLVLAFWTGHSLGYRSGMKEGRASIEAQLPPIGAFTSSGADSVKPVGSPVVTGQAAAVDPKALARINSPTRAQDPRQEGMNYLVLAHCSEDEARKLVSFLSEQALESAAFLPHNSSLFQVVVLRGFTAEQLSTDANDLRQRLLSLGRLWQQRYGGADFQRNGIYPAKYQGESVAAMIMQGSRP